MKKIENELFADQIKLVKITRFEKFEKPVLYAFNEILGIFVIRSSDEYHTWYSFYVECSSQCPICFRSVCSKSQADKIFSALCN